MASAAAAVTVTPLGGFKCEGGLTAGPGFTSFSSQGTLLISQFTGDPLESDAVVMVHNFTDLLISGANISTSAQCTTLAKPTWPNFIHPIKLGGLTGAIVPGGFLVPPKTIGAITILGIDYASGTLTNTSVVSTPKILPGDGWFYHKAFPFDVDKDGLEDIIAARAVKPLVEASQGELIWLRNPSATDPFAPSSLPWKESILKGGDWAPDVGFTPPTSIRGDSDQQVFYTSFFTGGGLAMLQCSGCAVSGGTGTWATTTLTTTILDASLGPSFDVSVVDLNGDGALDLLVTNHADNATAPFIQSQVVAFVAPAPPALLTDPSAWTRHTLAEGFLIREPGPNQASPGEASTLLLPGATKPIIFVSGDGEQRLTLLEPLSPTDPSEWGYSRREVWDCKGTVGMQSSVIVEGKAYLVLPCYDSGRMEVFSVAAQ